MTFRLSAAGVIGLAGAAAAYVSFGAGVDSIDLIRWLNAHDYPGYAAWIAWLTLAPVVLLAAALVVRRTPWPWVAAVTLHLASIVAGQARLAHLTDDRLWLLVATAVAVGLTSIVSSMAVRPAPES